MVSVKNVIGDFYNAKSPIEFWRKWNPRMHNNLTKIYQSLGGRNNPYKATLTPFLFSGIWHDLLFSEVLDMSNLGLWTLFFTTQAIPITGQKVLEKNRAKKLLRSDLEKLVSSYQSSNDFNSEILVELGLRNKQNSPYLLDEIKKYENNPRYVENLILKNSSKYWRESRIKKPIPEKSIIQDLKNIAYPILTTTYVVGSFHSIDILLEYFYK